MGTDALKDLANKVASLLRTRLIDLNTRIINGGGWEWSPEAIVEHRPDHREPFFTQYLIARDHLAALDEYGEDGLELLLGLLRKGEDIPASILPDEHPIEKEIARLLRRYLQFREARDSVSKARRAIQGAPTPVQAELGELGADLEIFVGLLEGDSSGIHRLLQLIRQRAGHLAGEGSFDDLLRSRLKALEETCLSAIDELDISQPEPASVEVVPPELPAAPASAPEPDKAALPPAIVAEIDRRTSPLVFLDAFHRDAFRDAAGAIMTTIARSKEPVTRQSWMTTLDLLPTYSDTGLWRLARDLTGPPVPPASATFLAFHDASPHEEEIRLQRLYDSTLLVLELDLARQLRDPDARNERTTLGQQVIRQKYRIANLATVEIPEIEAIARTHGLDPRDPPADSALRLAVKAGLLSKAKEDALILTNEEAAASVQKAEEKGEAALTTMEMESLLAAAAETRVNEEIDSWVNIAPALASQEIAPRDTRAPLSDDPCILEREECRIILVKKLAELDKAIDKAGGWKRSPADKAEGKPDPREPWISMYMTTLADLHALQELPPVLLVESLLQRSAGSPGKVGFDRVRVIVESIEKAFSQLRTSGMDDIWDQDNTSINQLIRGLASEQARLSQILETPAPSLMPEMPAIGNLLRSHLAPWIDRVQRLSEDPRVRYTERGRDNAIYTLRELGTKMIASLDYAASLAAEHARNLAPSLEVTKAIQGAEKIPVDPVSFDAEKYLRAEICKAAGRFESHASRRLAKLTAPEKGILTAGLLASLQGSVVTLDKIGGADLTALAERWGVDPNVRPDGADLRQGIAAALTTLSARLVKWADEGDPVALLDRRVVDALNERVWDLSLSDLTQQIKHMGLRL